MKFVNLIKFWVKWSILGDGGFKGYQKVFSSLALLAFSISENLNFEMEI